MLSLSASALAFSRGRQEVFRGIEFHLAAGEALLLRGANGSGKTTLLRVLAGLLAPGAGEVLWRGERAAEARRGDLLYIGHANAVKDDLSALENARVAARLAGEDASAGRLREALAGIGLAGRERLPVRLLSQGQKRRVALARLLASDKHLWLLDEPDSSLDAVGIEVLREALSGHLARGRVAVLASHHDTWITPGRTRVLSLG